MKTLILAAVGALALAGSSNAQTVIKETEAGVHSSPTAGATPQAREHPADDTTMLEKRSRTTVIEEPREKVVIERREAPVVVEPRTSSPY